MRIWITSVYVDDQSKALDFYTNKLGFIKKNDVPTGEFRWLTVTEPKCPDGVELLLEPSAHRAAPAFKKALKDDGIPLTSFAVEDIYKEVSRLKSLGVEFTQDPVAMEDVVIAVLDDTCGNLIQLIQGV